MSAQAGGGGAGCLTILGIVFIVLKLCDVIAWSWWWVLAPFIVQFGISLIIVAVIGIVFLIGFAMAIFS